MALVDRLQVTWQGGPIGTGVSTHFALQEHDGQASLKAFWDALVDFMPIGVHVTVPNTGDTLNVESGQLEATWTEGTTFTAPGINQGPYAAGVGACVTWLTGGIVGGRRVRGRTFVVPLDGTRYDTDGTLATGTVNQISDAATALIAAMDSGLVIYSRPIVGNPVNGIPDRDGTVHAVTGFRVSDRVSTLKSRR